MALLVKDTCIIHLWSHNKGERFHVFEKSLALHFLLSYHWQALPLFLPPLCGLLPPPRFADRFTRYMKHVILTMYVAATVCFAVFSLTLLGTVLPHNSEGEYIFLFYLTWPWSISWILTSLSLPRKLSRNSIFLQAVPGISWILENNLNFFFKFLWSLKSLNSSLMQKERELSIKIFVCGSKIKPSERNCSHYSSKRMPYFFLSKVLKQQYRIFLRFQSP